MLKLILITFYAFLVFCLVLVAFAVSVLLIGFMRPVSSPPPKP